MDRDQLVDHALEMRDSLAPELGLAPQAGTLHPRSWRHDGKVALITCDWEVAGRDPMILKCAVGPSAANQIAQSVAAQQEATAALGPWPWRVPAILAHQADLGAVAMERAPGRTASDLLEEEPDHETRREILRSCGAWLSAFHAAFDGGQHLYNPRSLVDFLAQRRVGVIEGRTKVAEPEDFCRLSARIEAESARFIGHPVRRARRHGDPNLRHFLIEGDMVHAIDFANRTEAPIGHDVVRLLRDFALWGGGAVESGPGRILSQADWIAFFEAYRFAGPEDPSIGFVILVQILRDWASIPADPEARSPAEAYALMAVMELAERVMPDL